MKAARPVGILCAAIVAALGATVGLAVTTGATTSGAAGAMTATTGNAGPGAGISGGSGGRPAVIAAVAAEDQYGSVIAQVGGKYVKVTSLLSNPNTDPH